MVKWTTMFSGIAIATLLLTGCGTATNDVVKENTSTSENQNNTAQTEKTPTSDATSTSKDTSTTEETTATEETAASGETNTSEPASTGEETSTDQATTVEQTSETTNEKTLQYVFNKENKEETASLKTSDNQPISLYVLPKFELSAEEPGKDVVLFSENDSIFMRIELLPEDIDWATAEKDAKTFLSAISDSITNPELNIDNSSSYEVTSDNDVVTVVLLKNAQAPVRLTLFTTKDADYRDAFLEMAKTIQKQ